MRVLDDQHLAQRQVADVDGVFLELGMQRPVGGHVYYISSSWPGFPRPPRPTFWHTKEKTWMAGTFSAKTRFALLLGHDGN
jgi:hypothetical protein